MNFYALDFETANPSLASICSVGIAEFTNGEITNTWDVYIDPEDWFDPMNIKVHSINASMVEGKQTFKDVYPLLKSILENKIVVHHTAYDKSAFYQACEKADLDIFNISWLDSAKVVRRTWDQFKAKGYGLSPMCEFLNISFKHHNALEDAIAAGKILIEASKIKECTALGWLEQVGKPITQRTSGDSSSSLNDIKREGNPDGPLYGETLVFTGTLFLTKKELSPIAAEMGCNVDSAFTSRTTILVVGTQNESSLKPGETKSSKQKAAEKRIAEGADIRVLSENDFMKMFKIAK